MCIDAPRRATVLDVSAVVGERTRRAERERRRPLRDWMRRAEERSGMVMVVVGGY